MSKLFNQSIQIPFRCTRSRKAHAALRAELYRRQHARLQTSTKRLPKNLGFAFDIDGVLVRGSKALPHASATLKRLQEDSIPFILLTNGGGYHEKIRAEKLSKELEMSLAENIIVQSHTPFAHFDNLKDKTVLIVGGEHHNCRDVAAKYGFKHAITPSDIYHANPTLWPFSRVFSDYHRAVAEAPPKPSINLHINPTDPSNNPKIDAIFVYNDPRDWGLDMTIIIDCLLSRKGILGTLSPSNRNYSLPNRGYQQDGQPPLYFSNPDLWFASDFVLPRLGQGGFRDALEGLWNSITGGPANSVKLEKIVMGKPYYGTYEFAEKRLKQIRKERLGEESESLPLEHVIMIGDNPASDIAGAMNYKTDKGPEWHAALVRTGVYEGGEPAHKPNVIVDDVSAAVQWGIDIASAKR